MTNEPQIYVADLAAYNAGHLHGTWIDATLELDDIQEKIATMLAQSPVDDAEEYAIHDYDGFEGAAVSEWDSLESVHALAYFVEEHEALGIAVLDNYGDIETATKVLEDSYHGQFTSVADYAQEFTEQTTDIPQHLQCYIDYESMARDWEMSGDIFTVQTAHNEVHVFANN